MEVQWEESYSWKFATFTSSWYYVASAGIWFDKYKQGPDSVRSSVQRQVNQRAYRLAGDYTSEY